MLSRLLQVLSYAFKLSDSQSDEHWGAGDNHEYGYVGRRSTGRKRSKQLASSRWCKQISDRPRNHSVWDSNTSLTPLHYVPNKWASYTHLIYRLFIQHWQIGEYWMRLSVQLDKVNLKWRPNVLTMDTLDVSDTTWYTKRSTQSCCMKTLCTTRTNLCRHKRSRK